MGGTVTVGGQGVGEGVGVAVVVGAGALTVVAPPPKPPTADGAGAVLGDDEFKPVAAGNAVVGAVAAGPLEIDGLLVLLLLTDAAVTAW